MLNRSILFLLCLSALLIPLFSPHDPFAVHFAMKNQPPGWDFWMGTDELGRDIFTRVWLGARISLSIGIFAAIIDALIGISFGAIAAFIGGKIEEIMMRIVDIMATIPYLLIVIFITTIRGTGMMTILLALCCTSWLNMARIVRAEILKVKEREYVLAARSFGASSFYIMRTHLIPNIFHSVLTTMTMTIPAAIFTEAFLSFLGLGISSPAASLGTMIYEGLGSLRYYPWRLLFPASILSITILTFQYVSHR